VCNRKTFEIQIWKLFQKTIKNEKTTTTLNIQNFEAEYEEKFFESAHSFEKVFSLDFCKTNILTGNR
jgi:hypothetical protein